MERERERVDNVQDMANITQVFTLEELKATEENHTAWHDGYCTCGLSNGWKTTELYDIDHIIEVINKTRSVDAEAR